MISVYDNKCDILIIPTLPSGRNSNSNIPQFLEEGFSEAFPTKNIMRCPLELASTSVLNYKPSYVIAIGSVAIDSAEYRSLRRACNTLDTLLVFWLHDDPYEFDYSFKANRYADLILSNDQETVRYYNHNHVHFMPLGTSKKSCFREVKTEIKNILSFFCGVGYPNRVDFFDKLDRIIDSQTRSKIIVSGDKWPSHLKFCQNTRLTNKEFCDTANGSMSTINIGRQFNLANNKFDLVQSSPGPRTFDAAIAGTMQLYFLTENSIVDYYEPDSEIVLIDSVKDVANCFERILDEPSWAIKIASRAQKKTIDKHLYSHRAEKINKIIENY